MRRTFRIPFPFSALFLLPLINILFKQLTDKLQRFYCMFINPPVLINTMAYIPEIERKSLYISASLHFWRHQHSRNMTREKNPHMHAFLEVLTALAPLVTHHRVSYQHDSCSVFCNPFFFKLWFKSTTVIQSTHQGKMVWVAPCIVTVCGAISKLPCDWADEVTHYPNKKRTNVHTNGGCMMSCNRGLPPYLLRVSSKLGYCEQTTLAILQVEADWRLTLGGEHQWC